MKFISCNGKQGTSLVKNSSQTVEIKDKTNEKKPYLEQNISNHKLDGSNLDHSIKIFNNLLSKGPIYMCSVCQKTQSNSSAESLLASLILFWPILCMSLVFLIEICSFCKIIIRFTFRIT